MGIALEKLFSQFEFGKARLRNRIVMAPMTRHMSPSGVPGANVLDYYRRRAAGGVGLIITEGTYIDHPAANGYRDVPAFFGEAALNGWSSVARAVQAEGGAIIPQLWHVGSARRPGAEPDPAISGMGPHEIVENGQVVVRAMSEADIAEVVASYARAAADAERLGFDGVEIHGAHGYLLDQFFWQTTNQRTDRYGGSLRNRAQFAVEVVQAIRQKVSPGFPIVFRFSQWKTGHYDATLANNPDELADLLVPLAEAGVSIFHVSTRRFWEAGFAGSPLSLAGWVKKLTGRPVIAVGSVGLDKPHQSAQYRTIADMQSAFSDLEKLLDRIESDSLDLVAIGRAILADAQWADKVRTKRFTEINPLTPEAMQQLL